MNDKIKTAFDAIQAEDTLKNNTVLYLHNEIQKRNRKKDRTVHRFVVAAASFAVLFVIGAVARYIYATPFAYVDIDVNPSIELTLNRFDKVIDVYAYNEDGESVLSGLTLEHETYSNALTVLMETISQKGYLESDGLVSVTLQTNDTYRETALIINAQACVANGMGANYQTARVDVFAVNADIRNQAYENNISPAKFLAIQELMEVDPTASIDGCRGHSISELRERTQNCQNHGMRNGQGMGNGRRMGGRGHHGGS